MTSVIELWQQDFVYRLDIDDEQILKAPDSLDFVSGATRVSVSWTLPGAYNHCSAKDLLSELESRLERHDTPDFRMQRSGTVPFAHPRDGDARRSTFEFPEPDGGGFDAVAFTMDDGTVVQVDRECTSIRGNEATTSDFEAFAASVGPRSAAILEARKGGWLDYKVGPLSVTAPPGWKPKPEMEFVKVVEGPWDSLTITLRVAQAASSDWAAAPHLVGSYLMVDGSHLAKTSRSVRRESWGTVEVQCWAAVPAPEPHDEKYPDDVESAASAVMSWDSGGACLVTAYHSIPRTQYESEPEPLETLRRMVETVALAVSRIPRTPGDE